MLAGPKRLVSEQRKAYACCHSENQNVANQVVQASGLTAGDVVRVLMTRIAQDKAIPPGAIASALFQPNIDNYWSLRK